MDQYVGLDVSLKETCVCVIDGEGNRVWKGKCSSSPDDIEEVIRKRAPHAARVALRLAPYAFGIGTLFGRRVCRSFASMRDTQRPR